ncbi:PNK3P-domain-containing protein, partial [Rickenella mellea]
MPQKPESGFAANPRPNKRAFCVEDSDVTGKATRPKTLQLHPLFTKDTQSLISSFRWSQPALGRNKTCLYGENLETNTHRKLATFDLDGTLINATFRRNKRKDGEVPWEWWNACIPQALKRLHDEGFSIIIFSNQCINPTQLVAWKHKIRSIANTLSDVPFRIFAATSKDEHRKPLPGMWKCLEDIYSNAGCEIDLAASFFVGDAAGRVNDFADTDRKFSMNAGLRFFTPEEYFLKALPVHYKLTGFDVKTYPVNVPVVVPSSAPIIPITQKREIVLFIGPPAAGKATFYHEYFPTKDYEYVKGNLDGCLQAVERSCKNGMGCVVASANTDSKTRKQYVDLAMRLQCGVRCFVFSATIELAWHNNIYRAFCKPLLDQKYRNQCKLVPYATFTSFKDKYEEPTAREGFQEIRKVNWIFNGDEQEKIYWHMWLQI